MAAVRELVPEYVETRPGSSVGRVRAGSVAAVVTAVVRSAPVETRWTLLNWPRVVAAGGAGMFLRWPVNWLLLAPARTFEEVPELFPHEDKVVHGGVFLVLAFLVRWALVGNGAAGAAGWLRGRRGAAALRHGDRGPAAPDRRRGPAVRLAGHGVATSSARGAAGCCAGRVGEYRYPGVGGAVNHGGAVR